MSKLKEILFEEYGGFSDKRIKNIDSGTTFIVDDRSDGDLGANRKLFPWFCLIFADLSIEPNIEVSLLGGVPESKSIDAWCNTNATPHGNGFKFTVKPGEESKLLDLANEFELIVKPGGPRYSVSAYKYVCPRTAKSLRRLATVLTNANGT